MTGLMRLRRTTWHENRGQRSTTAAGQSVWYKHRWKAIAWRSRFSVVTKIPHDRLTRAGKGITFCRTRKNGKDA
jgi:hypothetical protein